MPLLPDDYDDDDTAWFIFNFENIRKPSNFDFSSSYFWKDKKWCQDILEMIIFGQIYGNLMNHLTTRAAIITTKPRQYKNLMVHRSINGHLIMSLNNQRSHVMHIQNWCRWCLCIRNELENIVETVYCSAKSTGPSVSAVETAFIDI
jgi:hypothetical protein